MKKIALILALVMVFACALVACDPAETTSEPANESSVVENESTPAESEPEAGGESEPAESEPEEESEVPAAQAGEIVSVGKTYTTSSLFRQSNVTWGWDENADIAYPDEDGVTLTDGVKDPGDNSYTNAVWAGFNGNGTPDYLTNGYSWIVIDLGAVTDIAKISVYTASEALGSGIASANLSIEFLVSDDGETWTSLGTVATVDDASVNFVETSLGTTASGQYVRIQLTRAGWMFVSEVEVYSAAE